MTELLTGLSLTGSMLAIGGLAINMIFDLHAIPEENVLKYEIERVENTIYIVRHYSYLGIKFKKSEKVKLNSREYYIQDIKGNVEIARVNGITSDNDLIYDRTQIVSTDCIARMF